MKYGIKKMSYKNKYTIFSLLFLILIVFSTQSLYAISFITKLDDLYIIAIKSIKYKGVTKSAFNASLIKGSLKSISPMLKELPKHDRISILLDIAEKRKLITQIEQLKYAGKFKNLEKD